MTLRRVDPPPRRGLTFRLYGRLFGTTRPAMWFSKTVLWKLDPVVHRLTGGRFGLAFGLPTAVLETTGAKSGERRRNTVIYFHDGDRVTIIASKFGFPQNPSWFYNALANPHVLLGGERCDAVVVRDEAERRRLWELADRVFPAFAIYRERAAGAGRTIPILQLVSPRSSR